ncbi:hypothetical protein [Marinicella sp. W31]|uniref:hypothetical protein n=1 Tax=Marinicella sp. W31 TaxID=3023713 RepID=UPI003756EEFB
MWEEKVKVYDALVAKCDRIERKGKTVPHTSANGYMFSLVNKAGEIGIRFSKETQEKYLKKYNTTLFKSHNATMQGYILITQEMLQNLDATANLLDESYDHIMSLLPK